MLGERTVVFGLQTDMSELLESNVSQLRLKSDVDPLVCWPCRFMFFVFLLCWLFVSCSSCIVFLTLFFLVSFPFLLLGL